MPHEYKFVKDPRLQEVATANANYSIEWAKGQWDVDLDWSDGSIALVDTILTAVRTDRARLNLSTDTIEKICKCFGSYVGEVYRSTRGGTWGMITVDGDTLSGIETMKGLAIWPWQAAFRHISE